MRILFVLIVCILAMAISAAAQDNSTSFTEFPAELPCINQNIYPTSYVLHLAAGASTSYSIGDTLFILGKFDSACVVPDPEDLGPNCSPQISVNARKNKEDTTIMAERSITKIQDDYGLDFTSDLFDTSNLNWEDSAWVFVLHVNGGMKTTGQGLTVTSITIPPVCNQKPKYCGISCNSNYMNLTFNTSITYQEKTGFMTPNNIVIDTNPPQISSVFVANPSGSYTAGTYFDIMVQFDKPVDISELPDRFSEVNHMRLNISYCTCLPYFRFC